MTNDEKNAKLCTGTVLAYVGDAVIEVYVRSTLVRLGVTDTARFNGLALMYVTAKSQSEAFLRIESLLDEEEKDIYRRGRNANITHRPKNQSVSDYRRATGFEALAGYLYLSGRQKRLAELLDIAYEEANGSV